MPVKKMAAGARALHALLTEAGLASSRSEAERLIKQGGVEINGTRIEDVKHEVKVTKGAELQIRAGKKKFLRIVAE